jgi:hypothetical protein
MNKFWILVAAALAGVLHVVVVENAYDTGYEDAEMALGTTAEQCHKWWFCGWASCSVPSVRVCWLCLWGW